MFDRNTILALVVVGLILLLLPKYYELVSPKRPAPTQPVQTEQTQSADSAQKPTTPTEAPATDVTTQTRADTVHALTAPDTIPLVADYVTIVTPLYEMTLASNGHVTRYDLKNYHLKSNIPVDLHHEATLLAPAIGYVDFDLGSTNPKSLKNLRFEASKRSLSIDDAKTDSVVLISGDPNGQFIRLVYIFRGEAYGFQIGLLTKGLSVPETGEYKAKWMGGVPMTEPDPILDLRYSGAYAKVGDDLEKVVASGDKDKNFQATGQTHFLAVRSKYFIAAMIPDGAAAGAEITGRNSSPKQDTAPHYYDLTLREPWGANAAGRWTVYWGPMKYDQLKSYSVGLDETMNWGWQIIRPISKGILWMLVALKSVIPNYGVVIIVFSIFVKLVLWPLTRKSQVSMKKMAALQPEIKALRELHSKNPQAMNAAMMKLYKDRGVNPMSGCIPILLQMPILYALFIVFSTTIEFRQAPFMLWISDLSLPDVVYNLPFAIPLYGTGVAILPLVMGVTQFVMSKRTATDPNQKMMIYIMPVFMTLIFNSFPSGLTLYYTLFNVLAIVEQNLIKVPDFTPSVEVMEEKKGRKKF